jgi:hypothetical protein
MSTDNKKSWLSNIKCREDALKVIKQSSMLFYVLAGLNMVLFFIIGWISILFVAVILALGGFFLRKFYSRIAAVIMLLFALFSLGVAIANTVSSGSGGIRIIIVMVMLLSAVRAVDAVFILRGRYASEISVHGMT